MTVWAVPFSLAATWGMRCLATALFLIPLLTKMFQFSRYAPSVSSTEASAVYAPGLPHSEIFGSQVAQRLPEAYRSYATSFIAVYVPRHPPYALNAIDRPSQRSCAERSVHTFFTCFEYSFFQASIASDHLKQKPLFAASDFEPRYIGISVRYRHTFSTDQYRRDGPYVKQPSSLLPVTRKERFFHPIHGPIRRRFRCPVRFPRLGYARRLCRADTPHGA